MPPATLDPARRASPRLVTLLALLFVVAAFTPAAQAAQEADDSTPGPDLALLEEAVRIIGERFVDADDVTTEGLTRGAIRGLVEALGDDGHTVYLTPEEVQAERDALDGRVTGIGVLIDRRAGTPVVISVVDGSPADLAGLRGGDLIVRVDGLDVARLPFADLAALVRGDPGTPVRLSVRRVGEAMPFDVSIVRALVEVAPVTWARVPGSEVAVVRIVQFSAGAGRETLQAVREAQAAGARGLVLDLRGNPGGLVDEAVASAAVFMPEGVVYRQRDRRGRDSAVRVRGETVAPDVPVAVLVDYGTASSAEILAAALRDNDRAVLVGERTFGTGTILNTFDLSDGSAIRLGVLEWLTPDGDRVFRVGLEPDETVALDAGAVALGPSDLVGMTAGDVERSGDRQLQRAVGLLDLPSG
ncbi:S41 family peptidase [soil metagenome]